MQTDRCCVKGTSDGAVAGQAVQSGGVRLGILWLFEKVYWMRLLKTS